MSNETVRDRMAAEVGASLRARCALLWVVSPEEARVERSLVEIAAANKYDPDTVYAWDCVGGVTNPIDGKERVAGGGAGTQDIDQMLAFIRASQKPGLWILRDAAPWLKAPSTSRALRSLARELPKSTVKKTIVILTPSAEVPPELADHAVVVKWSLPDRVEIGAIFDRAISNLMTGSTAEERERSRSAVTEAYAGVREAAIEAAVGLTAEAVATCYSKSLVTQRGKIVPALVAEEKRRVVNREKGIEWHEPDPRGMDAVGGLECLKAWLVARRSAFSDRAQAFGLPKPKGILMAGVPGCLHGDTPIHDPVDDTTRTVRQRFLEAVPFNVTALGSNGPVKTVALPPREYPAVPMLRFTLASGETVTVTEAHRFMLVDGSWVTAFEVCARLRAGERVLLASTSESSP